MFLTEELKSQIKERFKDLKDDVKLAVFTQQSECQYCEENQELAKEVSELSDKVSVTVFDFQSDKEEAKKYGIDKVPAIAIIGKTDYGICLYGLPTGYDFVSFIEGIRIVSTGETQLTSEDNKYLANLNKDTHLQVFVSPNCPHCPSATIVAQQLAIVSSNVKADMIDSSQFPDLAKKYNVRGVPHTVINETSHQEGAAPIPTIIAKINEALG